jgi:AraC-like DNA-binding protein
MVSVFFTHSCLGDSFFELTELHDIKLMLDNTGRGIQILNLTVRIKELIYACEKNHGQHNVISFLQLLSAINDSQKRMLSQQSYDLQLSADEGERMNLVYRYAMDNYQNDIKLEDVAFVAMLSKNAFCKYFKKRTRKTFFQFLIELRIEKACELLMTEKFPINEIGHIIGFKNQSNFNRQFKKLKQTSPSEYRRTFLNSKSY